MNFVGLDIHKKFTYGVVKDKEGEVLNEEKFDNTKENFDSFLQDFKPEETEIVIESTSVWEHIYDLLESLGYESIKLANPVRTRAIAEAKVKTDPIDAGTLADLLRGGLIVESYIPPREVRKMREIMRQRKTIVKGRTQIKNKIHAVLTRYGIKLPYKNLCESAIKWVIDEIKEFSIKSVLVSYINLLEQYNLEIKRLDEKITELARRNKQAQLLMTIPGIGPIFSMEILSEIGEIQRFSSSEKLCSYAGLVPSVKQSGSTLRYGRLVKQANKIIKCAFVEASWIAMRTKETNIFKEHYKKLMRKKGKQKAICATARKMCCVTHAMLRKNQTFILL